MNEAGAPLNMNESTDIALKAAQGKVIMHWHTPRETIIFEPQAAFNFAEHLARAAHEARFGVPPAEGSDRSYLAGQVRARLTEELAERLTTRALLMLKKALLGKATPEHVARDIVEAIFAEVDRRDTKAAG